MLSRRSFLNSTLGAGLASATSDQAATQTPAVQPARKRLIVDAQVHVWKAESADWPWVRGLKPQMPEPFTIEKLVPLMDEAGVDRAVIVPMTGSPAFSAAGQNQSAVPSVGHPSTRTPSIPGCFFQPM